MAMNFRSWGEGRTLLEVATDVLIDAYIEAWWSAESLSDSKVLIRGWERWGLTISYARLGQGGGVLCWR